ncbi:hypothetical protein AB0L13_43600 [Saccharopolyspora shandongensis]|uniref:hypothetical protein n=1 Tax=Saccharopolyspora shandongensis TaxID=418495 RepID=UPI0034439195
MSPEPTQQRARALCVAAWLAILQGDLASAAGRLNQAEILGRRLDDEKAVGYVALFSGIIEALQGHLKQAVSLYEETIAHYQAVHEPIGIAMARLRKRVAEWETEKDVLRKAAVYFAQEMGRCLTATGSSPPTVPSMASSGYVACSRWSARACLRQ